MRLWSLHPRYLDSKGLVALWREGLLAQAVLEGKTRGYRSHPQLTRFRDSRQPVASVQRYLRHVLREAVRRGYGFDRQKIGHAPGRPVLKVSRGQLQYELAHLKAKLRTRDPAMYRALRGVTVPQPHPLFVVVPGGVETLEKVRGS